MDKIKTHCYGGGLIYFFTFLSSQRLHFQIESLERALGIDRVRISETSREQRKGDDESGGNEGKALLPLEANRRAEGIWTTVGKRSTRPCRNMDNNRNAAAT